MSTDERIVALEQGLAGVQREFFVHLSENNRHMATLNKVITQQEVNSRDVDHNLAILLGMVTVQGEGIKALQADLGGIKEQVSDIKQDNAEFYFRFDRIEKRFDSLDEKFDQVLQVLFTLVPKPDQEA